jgi:DNA-binding PadR family transcriptional regulator
MLRNFFLGIVKIHILYHADQTPVYGKGLMSELSRHGYHIGPGTLYPILHGLEKENLLKSSRQTVDGKMRRYYQITRKGRSAMAEARAKVRELVNEILE